MKTNFTLDTLITFDKYGNGAATKDQEHIRRLLLQQLFQIYKLRKTIVF